MALEKWFLSFSFLICLTAATVSSADDAANLSSLVFDPGLYLAINSDVESFAMGNASTAQQNWLGQGISMGRRANFIMDPQYYLSNDQNLANQLGPVNYSGALDYFFSTGEYNGGRTSMEFDVKFYLSHYSDLTAAFGATNYPAAYQHWLNYGIYEGRQTSAEFSVSDYLNRYPDLVAAFGPTNYKAALQHWLSYGIHEGRDPSPATSVYAHGIADSLYSYLDSAGPIDAYAVINRAQAAGMIVSVVGVPNQAPYSVEVIDPVLQDSLLTLGSNPILTNPSASKIFPQSQACFNNDLIAVDFLASGNAAALNSLNGKIRLDLSGLDARFASSIGPAANYMNGETVDTGAPTFNTSDYTSLKTVGVYCNNNLPSNDLAVTSIYNKGYLQQNYAGGAKIEVNCAKIPTNDITSIIYHELGHVLGLGDNHTNAHSPMYAHGAPGEGTLLFSDKELAALKSIYSSTPSQSLPICWNLNLQPTFPPGTGAPDPAPTQSVLPVTGCNLTQQDCGSATLDLINCQCLAGNHCTNFCPYPQYAAFDQNCACVDPGTPSPAVCSNTCDTGWTQRAAPDCSCVSPVYGPNGPVCADANGQVIACPPGTSPTPPEPAPVAPDPAPPAPEPTIDPVPPPVYTPPPSGGDGGGEGGGGGGGGTGGPGQGGYCDPEQGMFSGCSDC